MPFLTWILQKRCPELPDTRGLTWVKCYRKKIEKDYRAKRSKARAEGRRRPPKPEQRVVLKGESRQPRDDARKMLSVGGRSRCLHVEINYKRAVALRPWG